LTIKLIETQDALEAARADIARLESAVNYRELSIEAAQARLAAQERVIEGIRQLIADDHMFPTSDDAAWGVVTHDWNAVIAALKALDAADAMKEEQKRLRKLTIVGTDSYLESWQQAAERLHRDLEAARAEKARLLKAACGLQDDVEALQQQRAELILKLARTQERLAAQERVIEAARGVNDVWHGTGNREPFDAWVALNEALAAFDAADAAGTRLSD
jgi:hypothetical protein